MTKYSIEHGYMKDDTPEVLDTSSYKTLKEANKAFKEYLQELNEGEYLQLYKELWDNEDFTGYQELIREVTKWLKNSYKKH